uniref:Cwt1p n=1 Tax=Ganoderma boninense TaxID=34458 RepID=A0A5K1K835_9APHY|nr:Cwt1p [Ganoderma boninense]
MRALDTETGQFVEIDLEAIDKDENPNTVYAILSHTWDSDGEQTYEELKNIQRRYDPKFQKPRDHPDVAEVQLYITQAELREDNHRPSRSSSSI